MAEYHDDDAADSDRGGEDDSGTDLHHHSLAPSQSVSAAAAAAACAAPSGTDSAYEAGDDYDNYEAGSSGGGGGEHREEGYDHPAWSVPPAPLSPDMRAFTLSLLNGCVFNKHGRMGWPHARLLWVDATGDDLLLRWGPPKEGTMTAPADRENDDCCVSLGDVRGVGTGQSTPTLVRSGRARDAGRYFSLILPGRTLDLEAGSEGERDAFASHFTATIVQDVSLFQAAMVALYTAGEWAPPSMLRGGEA